MNAITDSNQLLRAEGRFSVGGRSVPWLRLLQISIMASFVFGCAMGSLSLRAQQSVYSGLKVPILLLGATLVCVPNFYVLNTVLGLRDDFRAALRAILSTQATVAISLTGLAPLVLFVYASGAGYGLAIVVNGGAFAISTYAGQITMARHYRALIANNPRHRITRQAWGILYVFVTIQLAWVLRPFVGAPTLDVSFIRAESWSNAYVHVADAIVRALGGS